MRYVLRRKACMLSSSTVPVVFGSGVMRVVNIGEVGVKVAVER